MSGSTLWRLFALLLAGLSATAQAAPTSLDWNLWVAMLPAQGYGTSTGSAYAFTDCAPFIAVFGNCSGNNPSTPYVFLQPPIDHTYLDPYFATPFSQTVNGTPVNQFFRLADTDALVTVVDLPPQAAYFGFQSYVFSRSLADYPKKKFHLPLCPDPDRILTFASIGKDLNSTIINGQIGSPWSAGSIVYLTTSNATLAQQLKASAAAYAGGDASRVFIEPVGSNVHTGIDAAADDFTTLIRYALPENPQSGSDWLNTIASHVQVYRISTAGGSVSRYGAPRYAYKTYADESAYTAPVKELTGLLKNWLVAQQGKASSFPLISSGVNLPFIGFVGLIGSDCLAHGTICLGDNQDTDAYRFGWIGTLDERQMALVVGVDHTALDFAHYVNLTVYNASTFSGAAAVSQTGESAGFVSGRLRGSASAALADLGLIGQASSSLLAALPNLYVVMVARHCPAAYGWCEPVDDSLIPQGTPMLLLQRTYLKPGSTTGPSPDFLVKPQLIQ